MIPFYLILGLKKRNKCSILSIFEELDYFSCHISLLALFILDRFYRENYHYKFFGGLRYWYPLYLSTKYELDWSTNQKKYINITRVEKL